MTPSGIWLQAGKESGSSFACGSRFRPKLGAFVVLGALCSGLQSQPVAAEAPNALVRYAIEGDAIPLPLTTTPGDVNRGRAIVVNRQTGLCLLCHTGPFPEERFQGNLAPDLGGTGRRWSEGQLRLRIVDAARLNPDTIMPSYYRVDGLHLVNPALAGRPILTAGQVEDVVAFLRTLRN